MERAHKVKPIIVHKAGDEGVMEVDALTGAILTANDQRPDWAEGLAAALLQERLTFYETRFGKQSDQFKAVQQADAIEYLDLGWIGVNEDGDEIEIEANGEHRSEVVAKALGIDTLEGSLGADVTAEIEVDTKRHTMTEHERAELQQAANQGFTDATAEEQKQATGTK
jgi:hypothetical protein